MIQKKVCMIGAFSVGKTSLVRRFVSGIFSDKYLTTVGVKIDRRVVDVDGEDVTLMVWDLAGEDLMQTLNMSHVRGSSGYVLVADGTRPQTLDKAREFQARIAELLGDVPFVLAVNKHDLVDEWAMTDDMLKPYQEQWDVVKSSAKTGEGVGEFFDLLARRMTTA